LSTRENLVNIKLCQSKSLQHLQLDQTACTGKHPKKSNILMMEVMVEVLV